MLPSQQFIKAVLVKRVFRRVAPALSPASMGAYAMVEGASTENPFPRSSWLPEIRIQHDAVTVSLAKNSSEGIHVPVGVDQEDITRR